MDHDADSKVETEYNDDDVFKVRVSIPHLKCDLDKEGELGIRYRQIFSGGYRTKMIIWSDENEKLVGKFFARLWRAKKGVPKFFACAGLFSSSRH